MLTRSFKTFVSGLLLFISVSMILEAQHPNVIIIVSDDQGYGDLSGHGNPVIKTPNIDKLHSEAVRFTDFHVDPTCAPTRAALMTGKYSHHVGVWHTVSGGNYLRDTETTIAEIFKENGYRTGAFGKWHLGANYPYRPMDRGFDEWLGHGDGGTGTTDDWFYNDRVNDFYWHNGEREFREGYAPDVFFNAASEFIHSNDQPFFAYVATYLPHHPHTIPDTMLVDKYKSSISDYVAYFFAGIDRIDQNIGKLRQALEKSGKADNTIFIFMSDNGGTAGVKLFNAGMRGQKTSAYEGGHRVPFFLYWPNGKIEHGKDVDDLNAHIDVLPTLIDLCELSTEKDIEFDGRSFAEQLKNSDSQPSERILFVENQRTLEAIPWWQTAGMYKKWRLVNDKELYDLSSDPGQKRNIINQHPQIAKKIRHEHKKYWQTVTPKDRELPRPIVGHPKDKETYLTTSEWFLSKALWNHAQLAKGSKLIGTWDINIYEDGIYRFELSRWPREANASINGIPKFNRPVDAWDLNGAVEKLIYGKEINAIAVESIKLEVGDYSEEKRVSSDAKSITFDILLKAGNTDVKGTMLNAKKEVLTGVYYTYITRLDNTAK